MNLTETSLLSLDAVLGVDLWCHSRTLISSVDDLGISWFLLVFFQRELLWFCSSALFSMNICAQWNETWMGCDALRLNLPWEVSVCLAQLQREFEGEAQTNNRLFFIRCWMCLKTNISSSWWWRSTDLVWISLHSLIISLIWMSH